MQQTAELPFKFKFVRNGQARGLRQKKATLSAQALVLDGEAIPLEDIVDTGTRDKRIVLALAPAADLGEKTRKELLDGHSLALEVYKIEAKELEKHIDRYASVIAAERNRQRLEAADQGDLFRAVACPRCGATIDLSEMDVTPSIYCRFCETVMTKNLEVVTDGDTYGVCSECSMFDRIRGYTMFYFYFLLVVYGFQYQRRHMCDACAQKAARRALLVNLIFILGVPTAIHNYFKARRGRDPRFAELAKANALARQGKYVEADKIYGRLMVEYAHHPGILMDQGIGHLYGNDVPGAVDLFNQSLRAASNYAPTWQLLQRLSQSPDGG